MKRDDVGTNARPRGVVGSLSSLRGGCLVQQQEARAQPCAGLCWLMRYLSFPRFASQFRKDSGIDQSYGTVPHTCQLIPREALGVPPPRALNGEPIMARITLGQHMAYEAERHQAQKKERNRHFVLASCLAGVLIGLYAGIVTKGTEAPLRTDWQFLQNRSQDARRLKIGQHWICAPHSKTFLRSS